jgi:xeroderma pigmentosum group C-complementing protein
MSAEADAAASEPQPEGQPPNWPDEVPYLPAPVYSPDLTPAHLLALKTRPDDIPEVPSARPTTAPSTSVLPPVPKTLILPITSPDHPACGQHGLFATSFIPPGSFVCKYTGEFHPASEERPQSDYDLVLSRADDLAVDCGSAHGGNEGRFVNDFRGVPLDTLYGSRAPSVPQATRQKFNKKAKPAEEKSANPWDVYKIPKSGHKVRGEDKGRPNAEFRECWDPVRRERCMGVFALERGNKGLNRGIAAGQEVLVSYGKGFWGARWEEDEEW